MTKNQLNGLMEPKVMEMPEVLNRNGGTKIAVGWRLKALIH